MQGLTFKIAFNLFFVSLTDLLALWEACVVSLRSFKIGESQCKSMQVGYQMKRKLNGNWINLHLRFGPRLESIQDTFKF